MLRDSLSYRDVMKSVKLFAGHSNGLRHRKVKDLAVLSWDEYAARRPMALK